MMSRTIHMVVATFACFLFAWLMPGCNDKKNGPVVTPLSDSTARDVILSYDAPAYDEASQTFSLTVQVNKADGATLAYTLLEGDSAVMTNSNGRFSGIVPFDEGYSLRLEARWSDTIIVRTDHVTGFIVPREPVEKMTAAELAHLINTGDRGIRRMNDPHLAQSIKLAIEGSNLETLPQMLPDVVTLVTNGVWHSVEVTALDYDDNNLITSVTLKPVDEQLPVIGVEDEDYDY